MPVREEIPSRKKKENIHVTTMQNPLRLSNHIYNSSLAGVNG